MDKPARWIAFRKLPNRRRIVFSDGCIPASVHLSAVGSEPCSATNSRTAATYSWIRVSATSDSGTASPSNTPVGSHCGNLGPPDPLLTARSMRVEVIPFTPAPGGSRLGLDVQVDRLRQWPGAC